jgi:hypothetical protein
VAGYTLVLSPLAHYFGFAPLPASAFAAILGIVTAYLLVVEWVKRRVFARMDL